MPISSTRPKQVGSRDAPPNVALSEPHGSLHDGTIVRVHLGSQRSGIPLATLRDLYYHSPERVSARGQVVEGNGFASAFVKIGRALYLDLVRLDHIVRSKQAMHQGAHRGE